VSHGRASLVGRPGQSLVSRALEICVGACSKSFACDVEATERHGRRGVVVVTFTNN